MIESEHPDAGRERDLILSSDKADLSEPALTEALKRYFDTTSPMSKRVKYCAVALVSFDAAFYPGDLCCALDEAMNFRGPALVYVVASKDSARKAQEFGWHS